MSEKIRIGIIGVSGYAETHLDIIRSLERQGLVKLAGIYVRDLDKSRDAVNHLQGKGYLCTDSFEKMLGMGLDLVSVPTSLTSHELFTIQALSAGCNVLVDKPPAATIDGLDRMLSAEEKNRGWCSVLFQSLSSPLYIQLKGMVETGEFGRPVKAKCIIYEPRPVEYYQRNSWAGRRRAGEDWVLDGPVMNALSHELNALLCLTKAKPVEVNCEMYRAHDIESDDTACLRLKCQDDFTIHYYATHAGRRRLPRKMVIEFELAHVVVSFDVFSRPTCFRADFKSGYSITGQDTDAATSPHILAYKNAASVAAGILPRDGLHCPLRFTRPFMLAINGAHRSSGGARKIPDKFITRHYRLRHTRWTNAVPGKRWVVIKNMERIVTRAFDEEKLFSEMNIPWGVPSRPFSLNGFDHFEG